MNAVLRRNNIFCTFYSIGDGDEVIIAFRDVDPAIDNIEYSHRKNI